MDNVIQNIKIDDIIPNNNHQYNEQEIGELAASIKQLGLLEPITVRNKNNKYELVLGNKRYKAAIKAGLKTIPAIIKKIDDNKIKEYYNINNIKHNNQFLSNIEDNNSDIINLSKLNKEYERDELKMNNEQILNNNMNQQNNQPAFGGSFFPSLEDEPTNMSFGPQTTNNQPNNNFIDLTDINQEQNNQAFVQPVMQNNVNNIMPNNQITQEVQMTAPMQNQVVEQPMQTPIDSTNNIINLESLKQNNEMISQSENFNNNIPGTINENISTYVEPQSELSMQLEQPIMELVIEEPVMPTPVIETQQIPTPSPMIMEAVQPIQEIIETPNTPVEPQIIVENPMTTPIIESQPIMQDSVQMNIVQPEIQPEISTKDLTPVINTIKSVAINLENFGYAIRITDEDLQNSYKITIEVDK